MDGSPFLLAAAHVFVDAQQPAIDGARTSTRAVYPELVRARVALGWDPTEAATRPVAQKARLTPLEAEHVRVSSCRAEDLAHALGISARHVRRIRSGQAWKQRSV